MCDSKNSAHNYISNLDESTCFDSLTLKTIMAVIIKLLIVIILCQYLILIDGAPPEGYMYIHIYTLYTWYVKW